MRSHQVLELEWLGKGPRRSDHDAARRYEMTVHDDWALLVDPLWLIRVMTIRLRRGEAGCQNAKRTLSNDQYQAISETALERRERGDCILVPNSSRSVIHTIPHHLKNHTT
jgi:hypothetical protein